MKHNSELRREARFALEGNWTTLAMCYLLLFLATILFTLPVSSVLNVQTIVNGSSASEGALWSNLWLLLVTLALLPVQWRLLVMALRLVRGEYGREAVSVGEMIEGYRFTNRVVGAYLLQTLVALAAIAIPLAAAAFISLLDSRDGSTFFWTVMALMLIIIAIDVFVSLRLSMIYYLIWDTQLGPWQVLKESNRMMKGHCWKLFLLYLSFIGWAVLAVFLTLGIGMLWLIPYISASTAAFYEDLRAAEAQPVIVAEEAAAPSGEEVDTTV